MGGELLTFDEALAELQMATHELRSLVAQGEIRAFRDEDVLKFRRTDILDLKKSRQTGPDELVIQPRDIGDDIPPLTEDQPAPPVGAEVKPAKHETEETELLTGIGKEAPTDFLGLDDASAAGDGAGDTAQTVVPTIEIADEDMIDDTAQTVIPTLTTDDETSVLGEADTRMPPTAPSLLAEEDEATEMATQEISPDDIAPTAPAEPPPLTDDTDQAPVAAAAAPSGFPDTAAADEPLRFQDGDATAPATDDLGITTDDVVTAVGATGTAGVTAPRRSQRYVAQAAVEVSPAFLVLAIVTFVVLLLAVPIFYGLVTEAALDFEPYKGLIEFLGR